MVITKQDIYMLHWEFIAAEILGCGGEDGELAIWEAVQRACKDFGEGIGILNYTDFQRIEQKRSQPDILLVSRDLGVIVIEVKSCRIDQIVEIRANEWEMQNFYSRRINPFRQAEHQLRQVLKRCDRQETLRNRLFGRAIVALPMITREEWREKGFEDDHATCPPIIFKDELSRKSILDRLEHSAVILQRARNLHGLDNSQWLDLQQVILGHRNAIKPIQRNIPSIRPRLRDNQTPAAPSRSEALTQLRSWISDLDLQQIKIGMQIPPGPQRIRGIAGSGKTLLLCQKAARMHLQHPDWDIALVFFNRSLYELMPHYVAQWLQYWTGEEVSPDFVNGKLKVLHAWGARDRTGFYSMLRDANGGSAIVTEVVNGTVTERLAANCRRLLTQAPSITPMFDAVLVDEAQDLATGDEFKYQDKQAFYWLAWQSLRPSEADKPKLRRLIWAYDEAQNLSSLTIPSYKEVFGQALYLYLSGRITGARYPGGILKNQVMKCCYRTPGRILMASHALGMGLLREHGMLTGFTKKGDWEKIGYQILSGDFRSPQTPIVLHRPKENSRNPISAICSDPSILFEQYTDYDEQCKRIAQSIRQNLQEGLQHQDILVLILGSTTNDENHTNRLSRCLQSRLANSLREHEINYYLPGAPAQNRGFQQNSRNADFFRYDDAITIARIPEAKGHEATMVYVVGLEFLAQDEANLILRNQLFVSMSRSLAWVHLSTANTTDYSFYSEVKQAISTNDTLTFTYCRPTRIMDDFDPHSSYDLFDEVENMDETEDENEVQDEDEAA
jgi:superfamily I DNA and RNA helicase